MKYCLNARCKEELLYEVDEISVLWRDRDSLLDLSKKFPDKTFILYKATTIDPEIDQTEAWQKIKEYNYYLKEKLIVMLSNFEDIDYAKENNIKFFMAYPVTNYFELRRLIELEVSYIKLGMPLFFELDRVKSITDIPIRAIPNIAYDDGLGSREGVFGQWIRPEDLHTIYADYIDAVEFAAYHVEQEELIYDVYRKRRFWPYDLESLIINLNYPGENKLISKAVTAQRINCGHDCQKTGRCQICKKALDIANTTIAKEYIKKLYPDLLPTEKELMEYEKEAFPYFDVNKNS